MAPNTALGINPIMIPVGTSNQYSIHQIHSNYAFSYLIKLVYHFYRTHSVPWHNAGRYWGHMNSETLMGGDMRMLRRMRRYDGYISHGFLAGTRGQFIWWAEKIRKTGGGSTDPIPLPKILPYEIRRMGVTILGVSIHRNAINVPCRLLNDGVKI